ncbi:MAG: AAA family ATPase [Lactobacillaceae bacterium]|jgi:uncharacterized protein YhaN|nr:AAA family ATPase [Lactobacillaceae bacterium]
MIIDNLRVISYGQLKNVDIAFNRNLQVILGNNEAGKSTMRQLITDIVFGFPKNNPYVANTVENYGGVLTINQNDITYTVERTRDNGLIIYDAQGGFVDNPEEMLATWTAPFTRKTFEEVFSLSQNQLNYANSLNNEQLEGLILRLGSIDSESLYGLSSKSERNAKLLLHSDSSERGEVNVLLEQYTRLVNRQKDLQSKDGNVARQNKRLDEVNQELIKLNQQNDSRKKEIDQLERLAPLYNDNVEYQKLLNDESQPIEFHPIDVNLIEDLQKQIQADTPVDQSNLNLDDQELLSTYTNNIAALEDLRFALPEIKGDLAQQNEIHAELMQYVTDGNTPVAKKQNGIGKIKNIVALVLAVIAILGSAIVYFVKPAFLIPVAAISIVLIIWAVVIYFFKVGGDDTQTIENRLGTELEQSQEAVIDKLAPAGLLREFIPNLDSLDPSTVVTNLETLFSRIDNLQGVDNGAVAGTDVQQLIDKQKGLMIKYGVRDYPSFEAKRIHNDLLKNREQELDRLSTLLTPDVLDDLQHFSSQQAIQDRLEELKNSPVKNRIDALEKEQMDLAVEIKSVAKNDSLLYLNQELESLKAEIDQKLVQFYSYRFTNLWIQQTLASITKDKMPIILEESAAIFSELTGGFYTNVGFKDEQIVLLHQNGQTFTLEQLSKGAAEQLYIAVRLALAESMSDINNFPIIIDDGFVNFDATRKRAMLDILQQISKVYQVIYFTAFADSSLTSNTTRI